MKVVTASGSVYVIDCTQMTVTRDPLYRRGDSTDWESAELRRDGETLTLLAKPDIVIGRPMVMRVQVREDGVQTERTTTPVVGIGGMKEELDAWGIAEPTA